MKIWAKEVGRSLYGEEKAAVAAGIAEHRKSLVTDPQPTREARALLAIQIVMLEAAGVDVPPESSTYDAFLGLWALNASHPEQHPLSGKLWDHFMRGAGASANEAYVNPEPSDYKEAFRKIAASARLLHPKWFARAFRPRRRLQVVYNEDCSVDVEFAPYGG